MKFCKVLYSLVFVIFSSVAFCAEPLLIFGGQNHTVFLGCINCNSSDPNSIWNEYGLHGSNYGMESIWNEYGLYGSDYSIYSPWNDYGINAPIIVDQSGRSYGYLSSNQYHLNRSRLQLAEILCKFHKEIAKDVSGWYRRIFR